MTSTSSWRFRTYPLVVLAGVALAVVLATSSGTPSGRLGGDLPEFIAAGRIVAQGDGSDLYDPARQLETQDELRAGTDTSGAILFAYPPVLAAPYALLDGLGYRTTYLIHTAVMVAALLAITRLLAGRLPLLAGRDWMPFGLAFSVTFLPLFIGTFNGQNTPVVLLALVLVWVNLADDRELVAGFVAGLALMKPQYGLVIIVLLVLGRRWRAVVGACGGAAGVWFGSALVAGVGWVPRWLDLVTSLSDVDRGANLSNEVSWWGLAEAFLGRGSAVAAALGVVGIAVTGALLVTCLRGRRIDDPRVPAVVLPSLLLMAPHALYYDAGMLVVALAALLASVPPGRRSLVLGAWWAAGLTHAASGTLGVEPVSLLVIGTWLCAVATGFGSGDLSGATRPARARTHPGVGRMPTTPGSPPPGQ